MYVVNLFGVPSAGKSTGAAFIFSQLKLLGINTELVTEFAKDKVWEENKEVFNNQAYIFGKQYFRMSRCADKVDVIITDSPLLLSAFYNKSEILGEDFNNLVAKIFKSYNSLNYLLERDKPYNPKGRLQTEEESNALATPMKNLLSKYNIEYKTKKGSLKGYSEIVDDIVAILKFNDKGENKE